MSILKTIEKTISFFAGLSIIIGIIVLTLYFHKDENDLVCMNNLFFLSATNEVSEVKINNNDLLFLKKTNLDDIHINNYVAYNSVNDNGKIIIKVAKVVDGYTNDNKNSYIYMLSANKNEQITVSGEDIIGKWSGNKISKFGSYFNFFVSRKGFLFLSVFPLILFFTVEFVILLIEYLNSQKNL